jgi:hypothetical protein
MPAYAGLSDGGLLDEAEKHGVAVFFGDAGDAVFWFPDGTPDALLRELMRRRYALRRKENIPLRLCRRAG